MSRKNFCFTINNPDNTVETHLTQQHEQKILTYLLFGRETGDSGTPHLQGLAIFDKRVSFTRCKQIIGYNAHIEFARNVSASVTYCKKENDYVELGTIVQQGKRNDLEDFKSSVKEGIYDLKTLRELHSTTIAKYPRFANDFITDWRQPPDLKLFPLREWQQNLNEKLNREPNSREIIFIIDTVGNTGKTWFARYYQKNHEHVQILKPGKKNDMSMCLNEDTRVLFVDCPRSKNEFLQYDFLEEVKDGFVASYKYESRIKLLAPCHVVVLTNDNPDPTKLSSDRYTNITL